jgi:hypothetical protein
VLNGARRDEAARGRRGSPPACRTPW